MSEERMSDNGESPKYKVTPAREDGRIIKVTVESGPHEGRSALLATFSSADAYYNTPEYKSRRGIK